LTAGSYAGFNALEGASSSAHDLSFATDALTNKNWTMPAWLVVFVQSGTYWHARGRLQDVLTFPGATNSPPFGTVFRDSLGAIAYVSIGCLALPMTSVPVLR
jgi:hypothetical protein